MNDEELLRYSRHLLLPELGIEGQERIRAARALIVGAGGLGSPASYYLAAAGVGTLVLVDHDVVDLTNLQRQILHAVESIGEPKVLSGARTLHRINRDVQIVPVQSRLEGERLEQEVTHADVVLDCSDNFPTRHALNRACVRHRKPLVSGAGVRFDGQVTVFDLRRADSPCYSCVFPEEAEPEEIRCAVMGVFAPLTGIVGTIQAAEALKLIGGFGEPLAGRLLLLDTLGMEIRSIRIQRDPGCSVCGARADLRVSLQ